MFIGNKKCRIYAACGVSQTPMHILYKRGVLEMNYADRTRIFKLRKEDANENAKRIHR